jgi:uncharacterized glyoxalase superfamily metalloenzyme YdcJ
VLDRDQAQALDFAARILTANADQLAQSAREYRDHGADDGAHLVGEAAGHARWAADVIARMLDH